ncbi:hypothetical protein PIB30_071204, partial [Stylosanthes scabra]|nr:hypothetical protein [Stylosanthes scabra]
MSSSPVDPTTLASPSLNKPPPSVVRLATGITSPYTTTLTLCTNGFLRRLLGAE